MKSPSALVLALDKSAETDSKEDDTGAEKAEAGSALASAIKSGDGAAIYDAFEALKALCEEY